MHVTRCPFFSLRCLFLCGSENTMNLERKKNPVCDNRCSGFGKEKDDWKLEMCTSASSMIVWEVDRQEGSHKTAEKHQTFLQFECSTRGILWGMDTVRAVLFLLIWFACLKKQGKESEKEKKLFLFERIVCCRFKLTCMLWWFEWEFRMDRLKWMASYNIDTALLWRGSDGDRLMAFHLFVVLTRLDFLCRCVIVATPKYSHSCWNVRADFILDAVSSHFCLRLCCRKNLIAQRQSSLAVKMKAMPTGRNWWIWVETSRNPPQR